MIEHTLLDTESVAEITQVIEEEFPFLDFSGMNALSSGNAH